MVEHLCIRKCEPVGGAMISDCGSKEKTFDMLSRESCGEYFCQVKFFVVKKFSLQSQNVSPTAITHIVCKIRGLASHTPFKGF